ncbi:MAG: hypothetical protein ACQES0_09555 [Bacteroidota bacterium]
MHRWVLIILTALLLISGACKNSGKQNEPVQEAAEATEIPDSGRHDSVAESNSSADSITETAYIDLAIWNSKLEMTVPQQTVLLKNARGYALFDLMPVSGFHGFDSLRLDVHQFPCQICTADAHEVYESYYQPGEYHKYDTLEVASDTIFKESISYNNEQGGGIEHFYLTWRDGYHHKLVFHFQIYHSADQRDSIYQQAVKKEFNEVKKIMTSAVDNARSEMHYPMTDLIVSMELDCIVGGYSGNQWYRIDELLQVDPAYIYVLSGKDTLMSHNHFYCYSRERYLFPAMAFVNQASLQQYIEVRTSSPSIILNYGESPDPYLAFTSSHDPYHGKSSVLMEEHADKGNTVGNLDSIIHLPDYNGINWDEDFFRRDIDVLSADVDNDGLQDTVRWIAAYKPAGEPGFCDAGSIKLHMLTYGNGNDVLQWIPYTKSFECGKSRLQNMLDMNGDTHYEFVEYKQAAHRQQLQVLEVENNTFSSVFTVKW